MTKQKSLPTSSGSGTSQSTHTTNGKYLLNSFPISELKQELINNSLVPILCSLMYSSNNGFISSSLKSYCYPETSGFSI